MAPHNCAGYTLWSSLDNSRIINLYSDISEIKLP